MYYYNSVGWNGINDPIHCLYLFLLAFISVLFYSPVLWGSGWLRDQWKEEMASAHSKSLKDF